MAAIHWKRMDDHVEVEQDYRKYCAHNICVDNGVCVSWIIQVTKVGVCNCT